MVFIFFIFSCLKFLKKDEALKEKKKAEVLLTNALNEHRRNLSELYKDNENLRKNNSDLIEKISRFKIEVDSLQKKKLEDESKIMQMEKELIFYKTKSQKIEEDKQGVLKESEKKIEVKASKKI